MNPGNFRLSVAVLAVRFYRDAATMAELRDALNARRNQRSARLTPAERLILTLNYLERNAPDLIPSTVATHYRNQERAR